MKSPKSRNTGRGAVLLRSLVIALGTFLPLQAQPPTEVERPDLFAWLQDSTIVYRVIGKDTIEAKYFAPMYSFQMVSDSSCRTTYGITEVKRNSSLVKLLHWKNFRSVHADAKYLTFNSRTANFKALPGDTISFYRELSWINPITSEQLLNNYHSLDTLDFSVYLVRVSNGDPITLLDSIGVLPRETIGSPIIYGTRPLYALVRYIVPADLGLTSDSVFVGITVGARGAGEHHFIRTDEVSVGLSGRVNNPYYQNLLTMYGSVMSKRSIDELARMAKTSGSLSVSTQLGAPKDLMIRFTPPADGDGTAIAIYDSRGNLVFYPYFSTTSSETTTRCHLNERGMYFVALIHRGALIETRKVIINQ